MVTTKGYAPTSLSDTGVDHSLTGPTGMWGCARLFQQPQAVQVGTTEQSRGVANHSTWCQTKAKF